MNEVEITEAQVNDLCHMLFEGQVEHGGKPVKREDIIHAILPGAPRQFDELIERTQTRLGEEFGMQLVELPVLPPLDAPGLNARQRKALNKQPDARKVSSRSYLYVLLDKPGAITGDRLDLCEDDTHLPDETPQAQEERKKTLGMLFVTLGMIHLRGKAVGMDELIALFKQAFGPVPGYELLVRDVWKRQKYLRVTPLPKSAAEEMVEEESSGPLVSWGPRAVLEFPVQGVFQALTALFPPDKHELIKKSVL